VPEGSRGSCLDKLRSGPTRVSGPALRAAIERLKSVRELGITLPAAARKTSTGHFEDVIASEFGGIQAVAGSGVSVEYISACVPDPASAAWATALPAPPGGSPWVLIPITPIRLIVFLFRGRICGAFFSKTTPSRATSIAVVLLRGSLIEIELSSCGRSRKPKEIISRR
jgi:hypothetical protein